MVNTRSGKTTSKEEASDDNSDHASDSPRLDKTMVQASTSNAAAIKKALTIRTQTSQKSTKVRKLQIEMEHFKAQQEILQQRALLDYKQRQNEMQRQLEIAQLEDDIDDQDANQDPDAESNEAENRTHILEKMDHHSKLTEELLKKVDRRTTELVALRSEIASIKIKTCAEITRPRPYTAFSTAGRFP
ncbi:hypothetical protein ACLKA7_005036 [Drosophila subpalustris]